MAAEHRQARRDARTRRRTSRASSRATRRQLRDASPGHLPDGTADRGALDGDQPEGARADRPADAQPAAGLGARHGRRGPRRGRSPARPGAAPSRSRGARPLAHAAVPTLRFALRIERAAAPRCARSCSTSQIQIAARRRALRRGPSRRSWSSCSASRSAGATRCARCCGRGPRWSCPPFTGATVVELAVPCTYDFEVGGGALPRRAARRRGAARAALQRHGVLRRRRRARCRPAGSSWEREARVPAAGRACGARRWTRYFPRHAPGCGCGATRFDRLRAYKARARARRAGRRRSTRCCGDGGAR